MEIRKASFLGRLANGAQADHGTLIHAVALMPAKRPKCPFNDFGRKVIENDDFKTFKTLCGKTPGRRSVGFTYDITGDINCPRCLKKLEVKP